MNLLLNINQYEYREFLDAPLDVLIIALKDFSSGYHITYSLEDLPLIIENVHNHNKKIYLSLNIIANEEKTTSFKSIITDLKKLNIDGYIVSDYGFLNIMKNNNLINKVIFNPVTNITNKYSAKLANDLGINHVCLANELNIKDLLDIVNYTNGNVEILAQGYYQICNSKRPLLTNFFKKFKINTDSKYYKIKEESRDYAYPIIEINNEILVYIDRERCTLNYLNKFINSKVQYLRIDTTFLDLEEVKFHIECYSQCVNNPSLIESYLEKMMQTNSNINCLDNISILKKENKND